jgi:class 3 adenylate cyclase
MIDSGDSFHAEREAGPLDILIHIDKSKYFTKHTPKNHGNFNPDKNRFAEGNDSFPQLPDLQKCIVEAEIRISEAFGKGPGICIKNERYEQILREHSGSKLKLVVIYVDLADSTVMARDFSVEKLSTIMQLFYREMSAAISIFNGYVLKYVGDAVIAFFPIDENNSLTYGSAINCAFYMIAVLEKAINPVLMRNKYENLQVRIGIDASEHSIIQYDFGDKTYCDILGYGISMAAKLTKLAKTNQVVISHGTYLGMPSSLRKRFLELEIAPRVWKYLDEKTQPGVWTSSVATQD